MLHNYPEFVSSVFCIFFVKLLKNELSQNFEYNYFKSPWLCLSLYQSCLLFQAVIHKWHQDKLPLSAFLTMSKLILCFPIFSFYSKKSNSSVSFSFLSTDLPNLCCASFLMFQSIVTAGAVYVALSPFLCPSSELTASFIVPRTASPTPQSSTCPHLSEEQQEAGKEGQMETKGMGTTSCQRQFIRSSLELIFTFLCRVKHVVQSPQLKF